MATIGNTLTRTGSSALNSGNAISGALISSFPEAGDVTAMRINLEDTGGTGDTFRVGIYSGNTRIGVSNDRTDVGTEGTYEFTFSPAVALSAATEYRFIVGSNSAAGANYGTGTTTNYPTTRSAGSAGLPPTTNSGGWESAGTWFCFELDYTPAGGSSARSLLGGKLLRGGLLTHGVLAR